MNLEFEGARERAVVLEERLSRHIGEVSHNERQRGALRVPPHEYGDGSWCSVDDVEPYLKALESAIEAVVAEGPSRAVTPYVFTELRKATARLAVELFALNLNDGQVLRRYAEWIVEALARQSSPPKIGVKERPGDRRLRASRSALARSPRSSPEESEHDECDLLNRRLVEDLQLNENDHGDDQNDERNQEDRDVDPVPLLSV
jgi:hypothetical protein